MDTKIITMHSGALHPDDAAYCGTVLREGGLVCFPTETVYGLGANAFRADSVRKIFTAKGRPADNPLIVHISDLSMLDLVTDCGGMQRALLEQLGKQFWPGPFTMIASRDSAVPEAVSCGLDTVGIRFPSHPAAQAIIAAAGVPVAAPSANLSGKPSPTEAAHVIEDMMGKVDVIIDGGSCRYGVESTVLDITACPPSVLRPGAVTVEALRGIISEVCEYEWIGQPTEGGGFKPRSPGMKYRHYAPKAQVTIYGGDASAVTARIRQEIHSAKSKSLSVGVLATDETVCYYNNVAIVQSLGSRSDSLTQASRLFGCLRKFDEYGVDVVFVEAVPTSGVGDAVMNRLYRAAGGRLVEMRKAE